MEELDKEDSVAPAGDLNVNVASITQVANPGPAEKVAPAQVDEVQAGPSRPRSLPNQWAKSRQFEVDFPEGL